MYFTDVVEIFSNAKCDYACTMIPLEKIDQANLPTKGIEFLNKIENPIMREQARDYFINRQFRKDLFVRGARKISNAERRFRLLNMNFVPMTTDKLELKASTILGPVTFKNPYADEILSYIVSDNYRPKNFADLLKINPKINFENIEQAITVLVSEEKIMPCQDDEKISQVKSHCDNLNEYLCNRAKGSNDISALASPVIGGAINIGRFDQIFAQMYKKGLRRADDMANASWQIIFNLEQRLLKDGQPLESAEENINQFKILIKDFSEKRSPILKALQII